MIKVSIIIPMYNAEKFIINALDSIPVRDDIEVLCIDDCSTDNTYNIVNEYAKVHNLNIRLFRNNINSGTGYTTNIGYDNANGEWIVGLDNDDSLITDEYNKVINILDSSKYDIVFISNRTNRTNEIWSGTDRTAIWCYFITKKFLGDMRMPNDRWAADFVLTNKLLNKNPRICNSKIVAYNYNYPREGSIMWNHSHKKPIDRVAVYTAIIGDYDNLIDPKYVNTDYDYYCFTNNKNIKSTKVWKVVYINKNDYDETKNIDDVRFARFIKIMVHKILPTYKYTIWIDANTIMIDNFGKLFSKYTTGKDWFLFKHTQRNCIYDEAKACIEWKLDYNNIIENQINLFKSEGYPINNGLVETNVMYRHTTEEVIKLCELWWSIVKTGSRRDQLSQMYCFWKLGYKFDLVPKRAKDTQYFDLVDHKGSRVV